MGNKKYNLPNRLAKGGAKRSKDAKAPNARISKRGNIYTNFNIRWTPTRVAIAIFLLGFPFLFSTTLIFKSGNILIGCVFTGIAIFVGLIYLALRYIEDNEF